jgi:hypothetical protein
MGDISMSQAEVNIEKEANAPKRRDALNERQVWQVYARRKYEEPLHEIGNVMADDVELAKVYARSIYDEFSWVEMVLIPRDAIVTVIAS